MSDLLIKKAAKAMPQSSTQIIDQGISKGSKVHYILCIQAKALRIFIEALFSQYGKKVAVVVVFDGRSNFNDSPEVAGACFGFGRFIQVPLLAQTLQSYDSTLKYIVMSAIEILDLKNKKNEKNTLKQKEYQFLFSTISNTVQNNLKKT